MKKQTIISDNILTLPAEKTVSALVFDIKRYSINDGPGIRITIFLKGCPLQCAWCHNPEGISPKIEKMYSEKKCIGCSICVDNCPEGACILTPEGIVTDKSKCMVCGTCAVNCPATATEMSGRHMTVDSVMETIERETIFFDQSGGGVTFSGGEPLLYPEFLTTILDECGNKGIHRAVDTSGHVKTKTLLEVAKRTDLFLFDLKMMDPEKHKKWTRVSNELILKNLQLLAGTGVEINIRIPLIHGINDDVDNIDQSASFIAGLPGSVKHVNLLPYHNIAAMKYTKLGKVFNDNGMEPPVQTDLLRIIEQFESKGIKALVGG